MPGKVVSQAEWLEARKALLVKEKESTRVHDELAKARRELPLVKVDKKYTFQGPKGEVSLEDLFEGRKQLITYHFMLGPDDKAGCNGCSFLTDNLPSTLTHLHSRSTSLVLISRAPLPTITSFRNRMGWSHLPWYSSNKSSFNYDFQASIDSDVKSPAMYNFKEVADPKEKGERPGLSVFLKGDDGEVYYAYSSYARGSEGLLGTYQLLDFTPLGRQEEGENGRMGWLLHDEY